MRRIDHKPEIIILDTSAFLAGFDPLSIQDTQYSVPEVLKELRPNSLPWTRFKTALDMKKLTARRPGSKYLKKIDMSSKAVGDLLHLSTTDKKVLALASELKDKNLDPKIVTDDYSMQNVASQLKIRFTSLVTYGIRYQFKWVRYCPACHRKFPADDEKEECNVCGTSLRRKPAKRKPA